MTYDYFSFWNPYPDLLAPVQLIDFTSNVIYSGRSFLIFLKLDLAYLINFIASYFPLIALLRMFNYIINS